MTTVEIIKEVCQSGTLTNLTIDNIEVSKELRLDMINYFKENKNRNFALKFLGILIQLRKKKEIGVSVDTLMLACYILGKHGQIEDCLEIWKAKTIDFDTFCGIDIQLLPFAGVQETVAYLKNQTSEDAQKALDYIRDCIEAKDFEDLETYFNETPWFV